MSTGEASVILRERILRGELPIGKVISRRKIATELGMSMLLVSEALQRPDEPPGGCGLRGFQTPCANRTLANYYPLP